MNKTLDYELIYDAANISFSWWKWEHVGIGYVLIFLALVLISVPSNRVFWRGMSERAVKIFKLLFSGILVFSILWGGIGQQTDHNIAKAASEENTCTLVEGRVEGFQSMPNGRPHYEKFRVSNVNFEYSDYRTTGGFNHTASKGGPISEDLKARICFIYRKSKNANIIVRLETAVASLK